MLIGFSDQYLIVMGSAWLAVILIALLAGYTMPWRSPRHFVRTAAKLGLSLWTFLLLAVSLETGTALFYDTTDSFSLANTSKRWYERHVQRNNMGFRDRKSFTPAVPDGKQRLIVLGDSFVFGHGVKNVADRFGDRLEARMSQSYPNWELYNLSEPGLSTKLMVERLRWTSEQKIECDALLLVYNFNDVEDLDEESRQVVGTIILDQPQNWFLRECYLPNLLYYRVKQYSRPEVQGYFDWLADAYQGETWEQQRTQFNAIEAWCRRNDVELMVVIFPLLHLLEYDVFGSVSTKLIEEWQSRGVPVIDLTETLAAHVGEGLVVNRFDAHPNERAHELAAEKIWEGLLRDQLQQEGSE